MKIKIQITVESDKGQREVAQEVAHLDRVQPGAFNCPTASRVLPTATWVGCCR